MSQTTTTQVAADRWMIYPEPAPDAPVRLICLPYAGGGASAYRSWPQTLPGVEVAAVELPGHETRLGEPLHHTMAPLIPALADAVEPHLTKPYAVFGHSMGARIAFELVRELRRRATPAPLALFVSSCRAPHIPRVPSPPLAAMPDKIFAAMLRQINGTPPEVFDDPELLQTLLPVLRADFSLVDTYEYDDEPALPWPVYAFGGTDDPDAPEDALLAWQVHTSASFRLRRFPGGHFMVRTKQRELTETILADLSELTGR